MELRCMGFDQLQNARTFRFEVVVKGATAMQAVVVADMALFLQYRVGIQDGPSLCAARLTANLEQNVEGDHVLTAADLRGLCERRAAAEGKRTEIRRMAGRRAQRARSQATLAEGCKRTENGPFRASTVVIPFEPVSVQQNAPPLPGVYALSNATEWVLVGACR